MSLSEMMRGKSRVPCVALKGNALTTICGHSETP